MIRNAFLALAAIGALSLTGCDIYFPPDDGPGTSEPQPGDFCLSNYDCAAGCFCDPDGLCQEAGFCNSDADCATGFTCDDRASCVPDGTTNCFVDGTCDPEPGDLCETDADCAAGCVCENGACVETGFCDSDLDCPADYPTCDPDRNTCDTPDVPPVEVCDDGADNDGDGAADCDDSDCADDAACLTCEDYTNEADCLANACSVLYTGINCTSPDGSSCTDGDANCTCESFQFAACATP